MDSLNLCTVEDNICSFSSSKLAMVYMTKYILKRDLKHSAHYKVGNVCIIERSLESLNLSVNTRCEIVECHRSYLMLRTLNESESRFVCIDRSFLRFYVSIDN